MSFTFGCSTRRNPGPNLMAGMILSPPGGKVLKIANVLPRNFSGVTAILSIIRGYIFGHFLLMTDLFPKRDFTLQEAYSLLYSVACCHQCTVEVMTLLRRCKIKNVPERTADGTIPGLMLVDGKVDVPLGKRFNMNYMGKLYSDSLICRYVIMRNMKSFDLLHSELWKANGVFIDGMKTLILKNAYGEEEKKINIYEVVRRCIEKVDITYDNADPASFGGRVFHSSQMNPPLLTMCVTLLRDCGIGILNRRCKYPQDESICRMLVKATIYGLKENELVMGLRSIRKHFANDVYYSCLWDIATIPHLDFVHRSEHSLMRYEDLIMSSISIHDSIAMRRYTENITEALYFLWKLPAFLLKKDCTVTKENILPSNYPSITVDYEGKDVELSLCLVAGETNNYIPAYQYNGATRIPYHLILLIISNKFIWSYDRGFILKFLGGFHNPDDMATLEKTPYENPIHHLIVPIKGITVQGGVVH